MIIASPRRKSISQNRFSKLLAIYFIFENRLKKENLPCVKAEKRRGEEIRRVLKELELLRTDARITQESLSYWNREGA